MGIFWAKKHQQDTRTKTGLVGRKRLKAQFVAEHIVEDLSQVEKNITENIIELSKIKPILAFSLNGTAKDYKYLASGISFIDKLGSRLEKDDIVKNNKDSIAKLLLNITIKNSISCTERDLFKTAFALDFITWIEVKVKVSQIRKQRRRDALNDREIMWNTMNAILDEKIEQA